MKEVDLQRIAAIKIPKSDRSSIRLWLLAATRGLCPEAVDRIEDEVSAHAHDAIETLVADGLPEYYAECEVLEQLGSPRAARRRFLATNLTVQDAEFLTYVEGKSRFARVAFVFSVFVVGLAISAFAYTLWSGDFFSGVHYLALFFLFESLPSVVAPVFTSVRRRSLSQEDMRLIVLSMGAILVVMAGLVVENMKWDATGIGPHPRSYGDVMLGGNVLILSGLNTYWAWRLARKLPRLHGPIQS